MEKKYSTVCNKIINNYSQFLSTKENIALKKIIKIDKYDDIDIFFINKIIDRIWHMTLTNPDTYTIGDQFMFLSTREVLPNLEKSYEYKKLDKYTTHTLELIDSKTITESDLVIYGTIVEIDYINFLSEPILPIDFQENKKITIKSKLNIKAVYNTTLNIDEYDNNADLITEFSEHIKIPLVNLCKSIYNFKKNNKVLTKEDKESLAKTLISDYLLKHENELGIKDDIPTKFNMRSEMINKYKLIISNLYTKYFNNIITLEEFINNVFDMLNKDLNINRVDKIM